jgi:SRSO17 transposase
MSLTSVVYQMDPREQSTCGDDIIGLMCLSNSVSDSDSRIVPEIQIPNRESYFLASFIRNAQSDSDTPYCEERYMNSTVAYSSFQEIINRSEICHNSELNRIHQLINEMSKGIDKLGGEIYFEHGNSEIKIEYKKDHILSDQESFEKIYRCIFNGELQYQDKIDQMTKSEYTQLNKLNLFDVNKESFQQMLDEHLQDYKDLLRKGQYKYLFHYTCGLLSDLESKDVEAIVIQFSGPQSVRNYNNFLSKSKFDTEAMSVIHQRQVAETLSDPDGMFITDGCDIPKKGTHTAGVGRGWCGRTGKVDNRVPTINIGYVSKFGHSIIVTKIWLSKEWLSEKYVEQRKKSGMPDNLCYESKGDTALNMLETTRTSGNFSAKYVGADSEFGRNMAFRDAVAEHFIFFVDVPCNFRVFVENPKLDVPVCSDINEMSSEGKNLELCTVSELANDPRFPWEDTVVNDEYGHPNPIVNKCIKVWDVRESKPGKALWVEIRKLDNHTDKDEKNDDDKFKFSLCNESHDASPMKVRKIALMRWSIEVCFKERKEHLGMDHYQLRSFVGSNRHMLFTSIAQLFLVKFRIKYSMKVDTPGPFPIVYEPVSLADYYEAYIQLTNNKPITNPNLGALPKLPWQVLTIGIVREFIQVFLPKVYHPFAEMIYYVQQAISSKNSKVINRMSAKFKRMNL